MIFAQSLLTSLIESREQLSLGILKEIHIVDSTEELSKIGTVAVQIKFAKKIKKTCVDSSGKIKIRKNIYSKQNPFILCSALHPLPPPCERTGREDVSDISDPLLTARALIRTSTPTRDMTVGFFNISVNEHKF